MANITVTYSFVNGTVADATEVNTNFSDILSGLSDGTKDLSVSAITAAGNVTFNANTQMGNATSDTITTTARLASDLDPNTDNARDFGAAGLAYKAIYSYDFFASLGAVGTPSYSFNNAGTLDSDTGMWSSAANTINFSAGATEILEIDSTSIDATVNIITSGSFTAATGDIITSLGAVGTPSHTFTGDLDTGMWSSAANTLDFATAGTNAISISSGQIVDIKEKLTISTGGSSYAVSDVFTFGDGAGVGALMFSGSTPGVSSGESATDCAVKIRKDTTSSRSINASGTLNASGADYAEYMAKSNIDDVIDKGEVCGVNSEGKLTKKFTESIAFVVKSTDPSYVGGDTWFTEEDFPRNVNETRDQYRERRKGFKDRIEQARKGVDRIAFSGMVPCILRGPYDIGDYVIAEEGPSDSIVAKAVSKAVITFDEFKQVVGQIWKKYIIPGSNPHNRPRANNATVVIAVGLA